MRGPARIMCGMILRLDSRRPIVWRSPHSMQIGVDPVLAVLDNVSDGDARLVAALSAGVTRAGLGTLAEQAGVLAHRVDEVLRAVDAALAREAGEPRAAQRPPLAIVGRGAAAERVGGVLGEAGYPVAVGTSIERVAGRRPAAAVLVSGYVSDPFEHQRWLRRDIAHLPMVFGEVSVTIGPFVVPGTTACLSCVERQKAEVDPARSAVAAQLWGKSAPTETLALATEAAVEAGRMLRALNAGAARDADESGTGSNNAKPGIAVRLDVDTGDRTEQLWLPSEHCGCRELSPWSAPALRRESGSALALHGPQTAAAPTTARALVALA